VALTLTITDSGNGTGATATVAGATAGAAVTVYRAPVSGLLGGAAWVASGSRVGSGAVSVAAPAGYYWWYAAAVDSAGGLALESGGRRLIEGGGIAGAATAVSGPVYQPVTDGAVSPANLWGRIIEAVAAGIGGLALPGIAGVHKHRRPSETNIAGYPCVVVTVFGESEVMMGGDAVADEMGYPVLVSIMANTMNEAWSDEEELAWRSAIRGRFAYRRLAGVPEVETCTPEPLPAVAPPAPQLANTRPGANRMDSNLVLRFVARIDRGAA
jgi:hypothetical protein